MTKHEEEIRIGIAFLVICYDNPQPKTLPHPETKKNMEVVVWLKLIYFKTLYIVIRKG